VVKGFQAGWGACSRTVSLESCSQALSCWKNTIVVGSVAGDIIILDGVTGSQAAVFSGHTKEVNSLTFQSDGKSVVSGSHDKTVKLWDMQTGGVIRTFYGHTDWVWSVSVSADSARIASGSVDGTIHLWNIQTGECHCVIQQQYPIYHVSFFPTNPQHLLSISNNVVQQWDINGHQMPPTHHGSCISFTQDGALFVSYDGAVVTARNSYSREVVAEFHMDTHCTSCCFSPDGRLIAVATRNTAYIWDIANSNPHLVETFIGHSGEINSLAFSSPSSLISVSYEKSVKFWQIGGLSSDLVTTDLKSVPLASALIESVSLQARDGIAISCDSNGMVRIWDILTGLCRSSFQTPAKHNTFKDAQLINSKVIIVWYDYVDRKIHIWDTEEGELLQTVVAPDSEGLRISGDGSKVFCFTGKSIQAWSMWTWEPMGEVKLVGQCLYLDPLHMDGSRIWVQSRDSSTQGWDFGISGSPPIPLSNTSTERPRLDFIGGSTWQTIGTCRIMDRVTGEEVFQLSGRYAEPYMVQWDGQYLITGYKSGEVLILDFCHLYPQ